MQLSPASIYSFGKLHLDGILFAIGVADKTGMTLAIGGSPDSATSETIARTRVAKLGTLRIDAPAFYAIYKPHMLNFKPMERSGNPIERSAVLRLYWSSPKITDDSVFRALATCAIWFESSDNMLGIVHAPSKIFDRRDATRGIKGSPRISLSALNDEISEPYVQIKGKAMSKALSEFFSGTASFHGGPC